MLVPNSYLLRLILCGLALIGYIPSVHAITFVPGDLYSSNYFSLTIKHYTSGGNYVDSFNLPSIYGNDVKGLSFGPNGRLYAVTSKATAGFGVVALDSTGMVQETYSGTSYVTGNLSFGKIAFATNGQFFVAGGNSLTAFTPGSSSGSVVYTNNQVYDVEPLPSGNILVLSAYQIQEITTAGSVMRTITPNISLGDARGIEYDPVTNDIFVTMLGYTGQSFRLMRLDGSSGQVEANSYFWYGDDMILTADNRLIVGSRTQPPGIFDTNLNQIGSLNGGDQMFVTQMPYSVPEPSTLALFTVGTIGLLGWAWRRRKQTI